MTAPLGASITDAFGASIADAFGEPPETLTPVAGGDINQAYRCRFASGAAIFIKHHPRPPEAMFTREAEGLAWLAEAGARVPEVLDVHDGEPAWLALAWVPGGPRARDFDAQLGEMLGRLHAQPTPTFGLEHDNFIGPLPQENTPCDDWPTFYAERRLGPMARLAHGRGSLSNGDLRAVEALCEKLPDRVGPAEPPARLHGDLWSGNVMSDAQGRPVLIDPACHAGHREVDLAMLALFGRVSRELLAAYDAVRPRSPGADDRVALYQLYPLLVHAVLFGGGYGSQAGAAARRYL